MFLLVAALPAVDSYVAAVYEHRLILNPEPRVPLSRSAALQHMHKNLDVYEEQAALAAQQGAQILVFPEDGLQGINFSRSSINGYLETIPDPQQESCEDTLKMCHSCGRLSSRCPSALLKNVLSGLICILLL
uniref:CN hydrolase domain-containing protein n=1 Tax=Anabas testudineus TaxID=64144 RepID=A0A7N6AX89_ANATE